MIYDIRRSLVLVLMLAAAASAQLQTVVFTEDFNSLTLGDSVNERLGFGLVTVPANTPNTFPITDAYSATGPAGWTVDRTTYGMYDGTPGTPAEYNPQPTTGNAGVPSSGIPDAGVKEWDGWNFVNKDFWANAAGGQDRELFDNAVGTVAVVDPDEYFDLNVDPDSNPGGGYYNSSMTTPSIPVTGGTLYTLSFDSSWRPESFDDDHGPAGLINENNQSVEVVARYDDGTAQVLQGWNSDAGSGLFKDDAVNEHISQAVFVPAGVSNVWFDFNIANAGNDWWWAVDNIDLTDLVAATSVYNEDFEGVALGDSVNERGSFSTKLTVPEGEPDTMARPNSFTNTPPTGWSVDNSGLPGGGASRDDIGVYEFEGWNFMSLDFWTFADGQGRGDFTKCEGVCAVADSDEFDDLNDGNDGGPLDTLLVTPMVDITSIAPGELALQFDSAWRDESSQTAIVSAEFFDDMGNSIGTVEAIRWESDSSSPFFHDDNTNETVLALIDNPADAAAVQLTFSYLNGSNNWYWAIDNVQLGTVPEPSSLVLFGLAAFGLFSASRKRR